MRKLFISSVTREYSKLRERLYQEYGEELWIAEYSHPQLGEELELTKVDECALAIENAYAFVCIFANRAGTGINVSGRVAKATHFELELFNAALNEKPVHVLVGERFEAETEARSVFEVLCETARTANWHVQLSDDEIVREIGRIIRRRSSSLLVGYDRILRSQFFKKRGEGERRSGELKEFFLLERLGGGVEPDWGVVSKLKAEAVKCQNERKRLSLLYIAFREVAKGVLSDSTCIEERNWLVGEWVGAAAWYGLHAHIRPGTLAAARSLAEIRRILRERARCQLDPDALEHPGGAIASALYSISKRVSRKVRREILLEAEAEIEDTIQARDLHGGYLKNSGYLAIRGSINRRLGRLGRAIEDYQAVLQIREKHGSQGEIGDALAELGFGYFLNGRVNLGEELLKRGVGLLEGESGESNGRFTIRAKRKLAIVQISKMNLIKGVPGLLRVRRDAREFATLDQL